MIRPFCIKVVIKFTFNFYLYSIFKEYWHQTYNRQATKQLECFFYINI